MLEWKRVSEHMNAPTANFGDWAIKHERTIRAALSAPVAKVDVDAVKHDAMAEDMIVEMVLQSVLIGCIWPTKK